jgi:hypothetical protein
MQKECGKNGRAKRDYLFRISRSLHRHPGRFQMPHVYIQRYQGMLILRRLLALRFAVPYRGLASVHGGITPISN